MTAGAIECTQVAGNFLHLSVHRSTDITTGIKPNFDDGLIGGLPVSTNNPIPTFADNSKFSRFKPMLGSQSLYDLSSFHILSSHEIEDATSIR